METATVAIKNLAQRLVALEAQRAESPSTPDGAAAGVCDRLRVPLARLAGTAGFHSLLSRALALAKADVLALHPVHVRKDGSLAGFDGGDGSSCAGSGGNGGATVVAHLLGLLVTFIGEPLTRQLVRDAWPDAGMDESDRQRGQL